MIPQQRANMKTWQCITGAPTNPGLTLRPRARLHRLTRQEKAITITKILPRLTLRQEVPIMLTLRAQQADRRTTIMQAATPMLWDTIFSAKLLEKALLEKLNWVLMYSLAKRYVSLHPYLILFKQTTSASATLSCQAVFVLLFIFKLSSLLNKH